MDWSRRWKCSEGFQLDESAVSPISTSAEISAELESMNGNDIIWLTLSHDPCLKGLD
ncbi:hypothetical protein KXV73_005968, partial [Aspergillus fumigatus]